MPFIPKKRQIHHSHDENVEETLELIENEKVAIETETPSEVNEPIEGTNLVSDDVQPYSKIRKSISYFIERSSTRTHGCLP